MNCTHARAYLTIRGWTAEYCVYWRAGYRTVMTDAAKGKPKPVIYPTEDKATIAAYEAMLAEYEPAVRGTGTMINKRWAEADALFSNGEMA